MLHEQMRAVADHLIERALNGGGVTPKDLADLAAQVSGWSISCFFLETGGQVDPGPQKPTPSPGGQQLDRIVKNAKAYSPESIRTRL